MRLEPQSPFGLLVQCDGEDIDSFDAEQLHSWVAEHGVVVLRGATTPAKRHLPRLARKLGPLLPWPFGAINELKVDTSRKNYLFTTAAVPLHWDGAFVGTIPRYLWFRCVQAPPSDTGGQTLFVDGQRVLQRAGPEQIDAWRRQVVRYHTDHVVHYGGSFEQAMVAPHPLDGTDTLRFAEPVDDLNPVQARPLGVDDEDAFHDDLRATLYDPDVLYAHTWADGDVVIADNHRLLHGRAAFTEPGSRHIQRINVLDPTRAPWQWLWDSLRIRRPEFMVAEVPILLIATLLVADDTAVFATGVWWVAALTFFLMFHFGDIVNCLADRDLDAVYKTRQSEAVYGLGVDNVRAQLVATGVLAMALASGLAWQLERPWLVGLVAVGLLWGAQYSLGPLHLKSRGLWQVVTLVGIIFVGPMLFISGVVGGWPSPEVWAFALLYGTMQEGTILVNTAEDYREDLESGLTTSAIALGPRNTVALSWAMVALGGSGIQLGLWQHAHTLGTAYGLGLLTASWLAVLLDIGLLWWFLDEQSDDATDALLKRWALRMPLWITALAWSTLVAVWMGTPW